MTRDEKFEADALLLMQGRVRIPPRALPAAWHNSRSEAVLCAIMALEERVGFGALAQLGTGIQVSWGFFDFITSRPTGDKAEPQSIAAPGTFVAQSEE
jgi:hypothetical protein